MLVSSRILPTFLLKDQKGGQPMVREITASSRLVTLVPAILLLALGVTFGQVTTASLEGVVADETGAVIPGVTVTATSLDTGTTRTTLTDDRGRYHLTNLRVGRYELRTKLTGFATQIRRGIQLTVGQQAVIDFTMTIGEISELFQRCVAQKHRQDLCPGACDLRYRRPGYVAQSAASQL
ncbi:MAG: carboxypeptidase regulatory-like domain-containing protein [Acidobacteria bacterium]|nr:carboxypeptidase regulatory-like domain-containing protein [Acidobacteriota bacterium]